MFLPKLCYKLREDIATVFYDGRVVPRHTDTEHFYEDTVDGEIYPSVTARTGIINKAHLKDWAANRAVDSMLEFISNNSNPEPFELADAARRARDAHKTALNQASEWGTYAHDLVDAYVQLWIANKRPASIKDLIEDKIPPESISAALAAEQFFYDYTLFPVVSEKKLVSKKHKYGGTLDTLFLLGQPLKGKEGDNTCQHEWKDFGTKNHIKCQKCGRQDWLRVLLLDLKTSNEVLSNYSYANQVGAYSQALTEMVNIRPDLHWILHVNKQRPKYNVAVINDIKEHIKGYNLMNSLALYIEGLDEPLSPLKKKNRINL